MRKAEWAARASPARGRRGRSRPGQVGPAACPERGDVLERFGARAIARQAGQQGGAIVPPREPAVEDCDDPGVGAAADEPPEALLQRQRRARQLERVERIAALLADAVDARGRQRIVGHRERDAIDHDQRQRLAGDVDALPEALRRQQHRADAVAQLGEQHVARPLALHHQRERQRRAQVRLGDAQVAEAGEEQQRAALGDRAQLGGAPRGG